MREYYFSCVKFRSENHYTYIMKEKDKEEKKQKIIAFILMLLIALGAYRFYGKVKADTSEAKLISRKEALAGAKQNTAKIDFKIKPIRLININKDSKEELQKLPGIGEKIAERIIYYRDKNGRFEKNEDITNIEGIGQKKYERMKGFITVK